jgi:hypothetical protein
MDTGYTKQFANGRYQKPFISRRDGLGISQALDQRIKT